MRLGRGGKTRICAVMAVTVLGLIGGGFSARAKTPPAAGGQSGSTATVICDIEGSSSIAPGLAYVAQKQVYDVTVTLRRCIQGERRLRGVATGRLTQALGSCVGSTDSEITGTFRVRWRGGGESIVPISAYWWNGQVSLHGGVTRGRFSKWETLGTVWVGDYDPANCINDRAERLAFSGVVSFEHPAHTTRGVVHATGERVASDQTARAALCSWSASRAAQGAAGWVVPLSSQHWGQPADLARIGDPRARLGEMHLVFFTSAAACPPPTSAAIVRQEWDPGRVPRGARYAVVVLASSVRVGTNYAGPPFGPVSAWPAASVEQGFRLRIG